MIRNALHPTPPQVKAMMAQDQNAPIYMLNLLKFKDKADYRDGEDISGRAAYGRYAKAFDEIMAPHGVTSIHGGDILLTLIGDNKSKDLAASDWDMMALVTYPSAAKMIELTSSDAYRKIHYHRKAGLEGQILLACNAKGMFS